MEDESEEELPEDDLPEGQVVRLVALDIGSASTKCVVADVDVETGRVLHVLLAQEATVSYAVDLHHSPNRQLSKRVQERGLQVLKIFAQQATDLGVTQCVALTTGVFRTAENGTECSTRIERELGIRVSRPSLDEEARLSIATARACSTASWAGMCWDAGHNAFQICSQPGELVTYFSTVGPGDAYRACIEVVQVGNLPHKELPCNICLLLVWPRALIPTHQPTPSSPLNVRVQGRDVALCASPNPVSIRDAAALVRHVQVGGNIV